MSHKPLSIRLILLGLICLAVGAVAESFRIGQGVTDFEEALGMAGGMEKIKAPMRNALDGMGGSMSFWQVLMLVGVISLSFGLLAALVKLAKERDQVEQNKSGGCGGCGGCH